MSFLIVSFVSEKIYYSPHFCRSRFRFFSEYYIIPFSIFQCGDHTILMHRMKKKIIREKIIMRELSENSLVFGITKTKIQKNKNFFYNRLANDNTLYYVTEQQRKSTGIQDETIYTMTLFTIAENGLENKKKMVKISELMQARMQDSLSEASSLSSDVKKISSVPFSQNTERIFR